MIAERGTGEGMPRRGPRRNGLSSLLNVFGLILAAAFVAHGCLPASASDNTAKIGRSRSLAGNVAAGGSITHPLLTQAYNALVGSLATASAGQEVKDAKAGKENVPESGRVDKFLLQSMGRPVSAGRNVGVQAKFLLNSQQGASKGSKSKSSSDKPKTSSSADSAAELRVQGVIKPQANADKIKEQLLGECGITEVTISGRGVYAWVPVESVPCLDSVDGMLSWTPSLVAYNQADSPVVSQGVRAMGADIIRSHYNVSGRGIKVGVLSDSFYACGNYTPGELPPQDRLEVILDLPTLCGEDFSEIADEGRAIAEIVYDVAPGAAIAFYTAFVSLSDFAHGIRLLADRGCDIVVDDIFYFAEPAFFDGAIASAVNDVTRKGVHYFSSAGNYKANAYESAFVNSGELDVSDFGTLLHDFDSSNDTVQTNLIITGTFRVPRCISLQWDQPWATQGPWAEQEGSGVTGAESDLDLFVYSSSGELLSYSVNANVDGDPFEIVCVQTTDNLVKVQVGWYEGPPPRNIKLLAFTSRITMDPTFATNSSTVVGHAAALLAVSVGAADYRATPVFNSSLPTAILEIFSSKGGTRIYFDEEGNYLPGGVVRQTPSLVGPDRGDTSFFPLASPDYDDDGNGFPNFGGTSASAPHVAALAALYLSLVKPYMALPSPVAMRTLMQVTADDMDIPGVDDWTGYGFVNATQMFNVGLAQMVEADHSALLAFKGGLDASVANSVLANWVEGTDHCGWTGVRCLAEPPYSVVKVGLCNRGLVGSISGSLGSLAALQHLDLSGNALKGGIRAELGHLTQAQVIDLGDNQLSGSIPFEFDRLRRLHLLNVTGNAQLGGCIPFHVADATEAIGTLIPSATDRVCGDSINTAIIAHALPFHYEADTSLFFTHNYDYKLACSDPAVPTSPDVVFAVTAPRDGILYVTLCGSAFDTVATIVRADNMTVAACNDDSALCHGVQSEVETLVRAGEQYYVVVTGKGERGAFQLKVGIAPAPTAAEIALDWEALMEFSGYVSSLLDGGAGFFDWSKADACKIPHVTCRGGLIAYIELMIGEPGGTLTGVMQQPLLRMQSLSSVHIVPGSRVQGCVLGTLSHVIDVDGVIAVDLGWDLCGDSAEDPVIIPSLPFVYSDDTSAGFGKDYTVVRCGNYDAPDVLFEYTATETAAVIVSLCGMGTQFDTFLWVFAKDDSFYRLPCDDDGCGSVGSSGYVQLVFEEGKTYVVVVSGWDVSTGPFTLDVRVDESIDLAKVQQHRDALLAFKASVTDPSSVLAGWAGDNYCTWYGVECAGPLLIISLHLANEDLTGTVPPALGQLGDVREIDLAWNNFWGPIPAELAGPPPEDEARRSVDLVFKGNTGMTGCVPDAIVNKTNVDGDSLLFTVYISGTGIGGACGLVPYLPTLECPETLVLANATNALTLFPRSFEEEDITLHDEVADNIVGDDPAITCSPPSSSPFFEGETPVTCRASDLDGNEANCSFNVQVSVAEDPLAAGPASYLTVVVIRALDVNVSAFTPRAWAGIMVELGEAVGLENFVLWRAKAAEDLNPRGPRRLLQDAGVVLTLYLGASSPDVIRAVEGWLRDPASAVAMQLILTSVLDVAVGPVAISVQSGGGACCLPPSRDPVCVVDPDMPFTTSDECVALGRSLLPSANRDAVWLGRGGQCGECAALWDNAGARSDPHFVTADGTHFDWMGEGDRSFCIISDKAVHVNAHLFAGTDGRRTGTWMDQIAVLYGGDNIVVSTGAPAGFPGLHGSITVNGRADMSVGSSSSAIVGKGLSVRRKKTRTWVTVKGILELEVEVVRASTWEAGRGPARDFLVSLTMRSLVVAIIAVVVVLVAIVSIK
eukprot:jgi/Mesvir1/26448/Mv16127-RA.2